MNKPACDDCSAAYVGKYKNSCKKSNRRCLAHLPSGLDTDFDRYEHLILSEIKGSLPSESYYKKSGIIEPKYDKWLTKDVRQRPDLIIRSPLEGSSIVIVEVDEGYHDDPDKRRLDKEREEYFRNKLTEEYKKYGRAPPSVSFVRIEPFDGKIDTIVDKIQKTTISPGRKSKKVVKTGNFEEVLKTSISEIRKRLTRRTRGTETLKITPHNYKEMDSKPRSPLSLQYSKIFPRRRSTLDREDTKMMVLGKAGRAILIEDRDSSKVKSPISPPPLPKKKLSPKIPLSSGIPPGYKLSGYKKVGVTKCRAHRHCELTYTGSNVLHSNYRMSDDDDNRKKSISPPSLPKKLSPKKSPISSVYSPINPVYAPISPVYDSDSPETSKRKTISPHPLPKKTSSEKDEFYMVPESVKSEYYSKRLPHETTLNSYIRRVVKEEELEIEAKKAYDSSIFRWLGL